MPKKRRFRPFLLGASRLPGVLLVVAAVGLTSGRAGSPPTSAKEWSAFLPGSPVWDRQLESGALPLVDLEKLPERAWLPDPLRFEDGRPVATASDWPARRRELLGLLEFYVNGAMPPAPASWRAEELRENAARGMRTRTLSLVFEGRPGARLRVELFLPEGGGPRPVFLTQANHRAWALVAASRGYVGCVYAGADVQDDTPALSALWPSSDASLLTRRAWAASRCVDYLLTLPEVAPAQIALVGHSRNGKQALIGGAADERIAAVISSSAGVGGSIPFRLGTETRFAEDIDSITRRYPQWLHPRLRFFAGNENRLPVDLNELLACLAPRPCLLSTGVNDGVESVWSIEQTWRDAGRVYRFLGNPDVLGLRYRPGGHETSAEDIEAYVDWLDGVFGRGPTLASSRPLYPTYEDWLRLSGEPGDSESFPVRTRNVPLLLASGKPASNRAEWAEKRREIAARIEWMLGEPVPTGPGRSSDYGAEVEYWSRMLNRDFVPEDLRRTSVNFGNYVAGDLFRPAKSSLAGGASAKRLPALIWLQTQSVPFGYVPAQGSLGRRFHFDWARAGYVLLAFDQIGMGRRLNEVTRFYERHPHSSLLGRTLADVRAAVDLLRSQPDVDPERIYVLGYGTGSFAALHAAALDERIAGVVAVAGITPLRTDTPEKGTGGVARWSRWLPLVPRLGRFVGREARIPYDFDEVISLVAPRPVVLVQPTSDYHSDAADLRACVAAARTAYALEGRPEALRYVEVEDYNRYSRKIADEVNRQLETLKKP